ncbi:hypothetical protein F2P81_016860 [Scophthalmus maximus]|uniref:Neurogenic mastermind-like N-terminal domain-containing protein n=1 Tax=Scophthalmus maximus TaxID=52904 RepID=A0A6A4SBW8_SCOMX|nr:hypothetical protein F2P81_016860 [Scophthalmus maximus]
MGEATPAQSASGAFVPMLGVGLGGMPGGAAGGPGAAASRGSAVPQLHNAIVERLRARIELCRRHHSTCESRYQRGQAESSDREHESTLHLLNIVHQGPGSRKTKGGRAANQQPPEYSRSNGEQKGAEGAQKSSTRIADSQEKPLQTEWHNEREAFFFFFFCVFKQEQESCDMVPKWVLRRLHPYMSASCLLIDIT